MKLGMMQPYFFPYLGYFQLVKSVDKFFFCDSVNFIKQGWINRNRILINNKTHYFTVALKEASSFKKIKEIEFNRHYQINKLKKTIQRAYKKAPLYQSVYPLIEECLDYNSSKISELAMYSVKRVCHYLDIGVLFGASSQDFSDYENMEKTQRIIAICKENQADTFINPVGGQNLYQKKVFQDAGINLFFLKPGNFKYKQFKNEFIPNLSIIDAMMFNPPEKIKSMLDDYELM